MAMAGSNEAANFSSNVERESFGAGDKSPCSLGQAQEATDYKWALSSCKKDTEGDSYDYMKLFADAPVDAGVFSQNKFGCGSVGADGMGGVYAQKRLISEEGYGTGRFLLSCSMASARAKKKRRSRATSRAPIKVFSTDTSNFMAMVHKLTGIPSNAFPFYGSQSAPTSFKLSPFNQGMPTLDTSSVLLSGDRAPSGSAYSVLLPALPSQQLFSTKGSEMRASNQGGGGQPVVNMEPKSVSYSDLMRSMCSGSTSNLPRLWEASEKNLVHMLQQSCTSEREGMTMAEKVSNLPTCDLSSVETLLEAHDKLASTDAWVRSTTLSASNMAKEELL